MLLLDKIDTTDIPVDGRGLVEERGWREVPQQGHS